MEKVHWYVLSSTNRICRDVLQGEGQMKVVVFGEKERTRARFAFVSESSCSAALRPRSLDQEITGAAGDYLIRVLIRL